MASSSDKLSIRLLFLVLLLLAAFYIGRPLYWKLSTTIHEIREKRQTVKEGFSKFVLDAQKSVGWVHDESDAGFVDEQHSGKATTRRILRPQMGLSEEEQRKSHELRLQLMGEPRVAQNNSIKPIQSGKVPTPECCKSLVKVLGKSKRCVCIFVKDRDNPQLNLKLNATKALTLPSTCKAPNPNMSECIDLISIIFGYFLWRR